MSDPNRQAQEDYERDRQAQMKSEQEMRNNEERIRYNAEIDRLRRESEKR